ncbi:MAG: 1,4-dihydroxy-2-naphthoate octaprenyltransferase [Saprospiraceae bacterium]
MNKIYPWINAARLRTLPLALSCVVTAAFLAAYEGAFKWTIFLLAALTTILLQVLANFANDYGDTLNGADNEDRIGPIRMVQSGRITPLQMKKGIICVIVLTLITGFSLLYFSLARSLINPEVIVFFILGILAIVAAIKYTGGNNPYGYRALGDLSVFLFFGILGVLGNVYLYIQHLNWEYLMPAISIGTLSMAVLNLNNMRDRPEDAKVGKRTIPVIIGQKAAKLYHFLLILIAIASAIMFSFQTSLGYKQFIYLLPMIILVAHLIKVWGTEETKDFDPELKKVALSTFAFSILFGLGLII